MKNILSLIPMGIFNLLNESQTALVIKGLAGFVKNGIIVSSNDNTVDAIVILVSKFYSDLNKIDNAPRRHRGGQPGNKNACKKHDR